MYSSQSSIRVFVSFPAIVMRPSSTSAFEQGRQSGMGVVRPGAKKKQKEASQVFSWGLVDSGALCVPRLVTQASVPSPAFRDPASVKRPVRLPFSDRLHISDAAAGFGFSLLATNKKNKLNAKVFGAGLNMYGQLGFQPTADDPNTSLQRLIEPRKIQLQLDNEASRILGLAAGRLHSLIATEEGLFALGSNSFGQCGRPVVQNEDYCNRQTVEKVDLPNDATIRQVVCGLDTSYALLDDGRLYAFGLGADGQLGNGTFDTTHDPQLVAGDVAGEQIVKVSISGDTALAVNATGEVFGWGNSEYRQLSSVCSTTPLLNISRRLPLNVGHVVDVAAGGSMCAVLTECGRVHVWGFGLVGQGPEVTMLSEPSLLPPPLFGASDASDVTVRAIHAGSMHMAAVNSQGDLYMWGLNRFGVLGMADMAQVNFPMKVCLHNDVRTMALGPDHTIAITAFR